MKDMLVKVSPIVVLALVIGLIITFPVVWVWNAIIPTIFGLPTIGFWQAFGLMFLANVFFKNTSSSNK